MFTKIVEKALNEQIEADIIASFLPDARYEQNLDIRISETENQDDEEIFDSLVIKDYDQSSHSKSK